MAENFNLDQGLVFTADDDDDVDLDDEDEFHFASDQPPQRQPPRPSPSSTFQFSSGSEGSSQPSTQRVQPTRPPPSRTFQFSSESEEPSPVVTQQQASQGAQPIQAVMSFLFGQRNQPQPTPVLSTQARPVPVPIQPRPEFIEIHKKPTELTAESYIPESEIVLWNNFFQTKPLNTEEVFQERNHYREARKLLWYKGYITITGACGEGKSCLAEHLMISFLMKPKGLSRDPGWQEKERTIPEMDRPLYECVYINSPEEWYMKVDPTKRQVIIIDDLFGSSATSFHKIEPWIPHLDTIVQTAIDNRPNLLLITTVHSHHLDKLPSYIKKKRMFSPDCLIEVLAPKGDRYGGCSYVIEKICEYYDFKLGYRDQDEIDYKSVTEGFGIKARLFAVVTSFHMEGKQFFANPNKLFENVIQKVYTFDKIVFYTLAVAVLFDGKLDLDKEVFEQYTDREQKIFKELMEPLEVPANVTLGKMRFAATLLNGAFFSPRQLHCWTFHHEHVMHLVSESINRKIPKKLVELCSHDFLMERLRAGNYFGSKMESALTVWPKEYDILSQRFVFEILSGNVRLIASHSALNSEKFAVDFFKFMEEMGSLLPVAQQKGQLNRSLFFWTAYYGQEATVKLFLTNEELKEIREEQWFKDELQPALFSACCRSSISHGKMVRLLLENGAPLDSKETISDEEDLLELYGDDVLDLLKMSPTLIHVAAQFGSGDTIKILNEKGLDITAPLVDGYTPLHIACRNSDDGAARALIDLKCDIDAQTPNGYLPVHEAFRVGKESLVRQLHYKKKGGYLPHIQFEGDTTALYNAACIGDKQLASMIVALSPSANGNKSVDPWPPLAEAAAQGNLELVRYLVENKAEINQSGLSGWTALHMAVLFYHEDIISFLLEKGADIECTTLNKMTPLHLATENGYFNICNTLLNKGAKPEARTCQGEFPLTLAAKNGHYDLLKYFLEEKLELPLPKEQEITKGTKDEILVALLQRAEPQHSNRYLYGFY